MPSKRSEEKKNWLCRLFGHKFDLIEVAIFNIECSAINREELAPQIVCQRCGFTFKIK
jgi:hypothetical protein